MVKTDIERNGKIVLFLNQLSIFVLLVVLFFGALYMFAGDLTLAIPVSVVLVVLMFIISNSLIRSKMKLKKSGFSVGARIAWFIYILLIIPVTIIAIHGFSIEFLDKDSIQKQGMAKVKLIKDLNEDFVSQYEKYCDELNLCMNKSYHLYAGGGWTAVDAVEQADCDVPANAIESLTYSEYGTQINGYVDDKRSDFEEMAESNFSGGLEDYLSDRSNLIKNWNRFLIASELSAIDTLLMRSEKDLSEFLNQKANGRSLSVWDSNVAKSTLIAKPFEVIKRGFNLGVYGAVFLLHLFLLLPYLVAPKKTYPPGGRKKNLDNGGVTVR